MRTDIWMAIKKTGSNFNPRAVIRTTKTQPSLDANEIAFKLSLDIPDSLFSKPTLSAKITVPDSAVSPVVIEPLVVDNIQDAIKQHTGIDVKLTVESVGQEETPA